MEDVSKFIDTNTRHINIDELYELQYWSERLIVNQSEIVEAVNAVGSHIEEVKNYLKEKASL